MTFKSNIVLYLRSDDAYSGVLTVFSETPDLSIKEDAVSALVLDRDPQRTLNKLPSVLKMKLP